MRKNSIGILAILAFAVLTAACTQQADIGITTKVKSLLETDRSVANATQIQVTTEDKVVTLAGPVDSPATKARAVTVAKGVEGVKKVVDNLTVAPGSVAMAPAPVEAVPAPAIEAAPAEPIAQPESAQAAPAKPVAQPATAAAAPAKIPAKTIPQAPAAPAIEPAPATAAVQPSTAPEAPPTTEAQPAVEAPPASSMAMTDTPATNTAPQTDIAITQAVKEKLSLQPETSSENISVDTHAGVVTLSGTVKTPEAKQQVIQIARNTQGVQGVEDKLTVISS